MFASTSSSASSASVSSVSPAPRASRVIRRVPFFYGWVILAVGTLGIIMMGPSQTFTVSLFIDSLVADLGISRANISLLYGIATLSASLMLPLTGRVVDRYGSRRMIVVTVLAFGLATMGLSQARGPISLLVLFLLVRFLGFGSMQLVCNNVIAQWFVRRRGFVMGLAGQSLGISLMLFPFLASQLILHVGWRWAWVALGAGAMAIMLPVGWLFFRDKPELYGLHPDGDGDTEWERAAASDEVHWTLAQARRTGIFWLFAVSFSVMAMLLSGMVFHQAALFRLRGFDLNVAVLGFQLSAFSSVGGNFAVGYLLDRVRPRILLRVQLVGLLAIMVLVQIMDNIAWVILYAALSGLISASFRVMDATVWAKYFGRKHLGSIRGATMLGLLSGTALGAYPLGLSYDLTGGYQTALTLLMVLPVLIIIASIWIKPPAAAASLSARLGELDTRGGNV